MLDIRHKEPQHISAVVSSGTSSVEREDFGVIQGTS